jgi:hypothetical protein
MYYERLALEINATIAGLDIKKPSVLKGASGVEHRFSFLATDGKRFYGFDISPEVGEVEILRSFVKRIDTNAETYVVCLSGRPSTDAQRMAAKYGISVLTPGQVGDFFSMRVSEMIRSPEKAALAGNL